MFRIVQDEVWSLDGKYSLILAMVTVGRAKYTHTLVQNFEVCHVSSKFRAHILCVYILCISSPPQSPSPKLVTTHSLFGVVTKLLAVLQ